MQYLIYGSIKNIFQYLSRKNCLRKVKIEDIFTLNWFQSQFILVIGYFWISRPLTYICILRLFLNYSKQRLMYLQQETKKPEYIFMDQNGKDFVIIYKLNASETQSQQENKELRETFKLNEKYELINFNINDFKIVNSVVQPKSDYEFYNLFVLQNSEEEFNKRPHNMFKLDINQKLILIKFGQNQYLNAWVKKKQIIIK